MPAKWEGGKIAAQIEAAQNRAAAVAAERLRAEAVARAPVDNGILRGSAAVTQTSFADAGTAAVSFDTVYAARQHEELGWAHPNGGQAKYLESALNDLSGELQQIAAAEIRRALGG